MRPLVPAPPRPLRCPRLRLGPLPGAALTGITPTIPSYTTSRDLTVFSGETLIDVPAGTFILQVRADGSWALQFSE